MHTPGIRDSDDAARARQRFRHEALSPVDPRDGAADAPRAPIPAGAARRSAEHVIDSENFTPRLISLLSNQLVWRESRLLRERFDLGTNDWRVISALAVRPGAMLTEVSEFIAVNKAIISKSVGTLIDRGLVVSAELSGRSRALYLTDAGVAMHDRMLPISMGGQDYILDGMSAEQVDRFNALLRRLLARTEELAFRDHGAGDAEASDPPR